MTRTAQPETCAISRLRIEDRDEVLCVALHHRGWSTYSILNDYNNCLRRKASRENRSQTIKSPFAFIGVTQYLDYGTVDGYDPERKPGTYTHEYRFLILKEIAETLLNRPFNLEDLEEDVITLIELAFELRIELNSVGILGHERKELQEMIQQQKLIQTIDTILNRKINEYKMNHSEPGHKQSLEWKELERINDRPETIYSDRHIELLRRSLTELLDQHQIDPSDLNVALSDEDGLIIELPPIPEWVVIEATSLFHDVLEEDFETIGWTPH